MQPRSCLRRWDGHDEGNSFLLAFRLESWRTHRLLLVCIRAGGHNYIPDLGGWQDPHDDSDLMAAEDSEQLSDAQDEEAEIESDIVIVAVDSDEEAQQHTPWAPSRAGHPQKVY
jgi:hypothetical protein